MSRTIIVTRHAGAIALLRRLGVEGEVVSSLSDGDAAALTPADRVYGPLPVRLIAALTARGVPYYAIDMDLEAGQRGRELGPEQMIAAGAAARRYAVHAIASLPETLKVGPAPAAKPGRMRTLMAEMPTRGKAAIVALAAAVALKVATVIVDAVWQGVKDFIADPSAVLVGAGRVLAGDLDGWALFRSALTGATALAALAVALLVVQRLAGRVLHTTFRTVPVEPRAVLIQGLSPLRDPTVAEPFREIDLRFSGLSQGGLRAAHAQLTERLAATPADPDLRDALDQIARIPSERVAWQQNLRAILSHAPGLKRIYVIPAQAASAAGDGEAQARAFCALVGAILRRSGLGHVAVELAPGKAINYEDHDQALAAIAGAMRAARGHGLREADIAIDGTAGLKVFSIAAAVATINSRALLTYVNTDGETRVYDGRMALAEAGA